MSVTATRKPDRGHAPGFQALFGLGRALRAATLWWKRRRPTTRLSLTRRVLFVNMLAVVLLGGGMLYLDRYERGLIDTELEALGIQGGIFAAALGEGAVLEDLGEDPVLAPSLAQGMVRRLTEPAGARARLFLPNGRMIADSRSLSGPGGTIQIEELPPPEKGPNVLSRFVRAVSNVLPSRRKYPPYTEQAREQPTDYPEVMQALDGHMAAKVRADRSTGGLVLSVAVPVRRYKQVLGALLLSSGSAELERQVNSVRTDILRLFLFSLVFTFLLSLYLASTIVRPIRQLAQSARDVRLGGGRQIEIPDFAPRRDEIGELSTVLSEMTRALWRRMDAIERFAADVAHEIKNPLSSLRSAVETAARVKDADQQRKLMGIILDDVQRLDRLISDISDASRLDAEMSRLERHPVPLAGMFRTLAEVHEATRKPDAARIELDLGSADRGSESLAVLGKETRLVQVFQNLLSNAVSFSPPGGVIRIICRREGGEIVVVIDDDGRGIPAGKLEAIFDRFYSERPSGEKFGTHSGLGLSISKQIVEAHGGQISAANRQNSDGGIAGARFVVRLPAAAA